VYASLTRFDNDGRAGSGRLGRFNAAVPAGLTRAGDNQIDEWVPGMRHSFWCTAMWLRCLKGATAPPSSRVLVVASGAW